ncbi:MAG TPA: hypothetical protein PKD64_08565 [Pirellulaceae bacterium]|nr:hypothetical protein [Pirellulaceae bacterium]HMO92239.1 hypothetical protein [Pirellulaceae bacterium]HMP70748.1 hypothetical protein [Pirellulaceae bacterium]
MAQKKRKKIQDQDLSRLKYFDKLATLYKRLHNEAVIATKPVTENSTLINLCC